jgi:hypothetical protein
MDWEVIEDFPKYEISKAGQVRVRMTGTLLKTCLRGSTGQKYPSVWLRIAPGKRVQKLVHILVLETFLGPGAVGDWARHLDGDASNCNLKNLKWGTPQENWEDRRKHGRGGSGVDQASAKLTLAQLQEIRTKKWKHGEKRQWAKTHGVSESTVYKALVGDTYPLDKP